ncbi:hypothetical protein CEXT_19171 [Caerostris extrusa]|uniref:Uncharacterized protein n=1 Tax=Caerostris extrusa TaxID=172846 RepID=A0AAV4XBM7_CAEEX|nr:hypothetical protein CEXT_19171 [Caerostris extrusa]
MLKTSQGDTYSSHTGRDSTSAMPMILRVLYFSFRLKGWSQGNCAVGDLRLRNHFRKLMVRCYSYSAPSTPSSREISSEPKRL